LTQTPTATPFADPKLIPCVIAGFSYTKHQLNETEEWYWTAAPMIVVSSGPPVIIGLAGSWIADNNSQMTINQWATSSQQNAKWRLTTDCLDITQPANQYDYTTSAFPVTAGVRYKFRIVTTVPSSNTRLYWYGAPSTLETCEVSNATCVMPTNTPRATHVGDPQLQPCGTKGVLFTIHRPNESERWYITSTALIAVTSGPPVIIGLAGSWISTKTHNTVTLNQYGQTTNEYAKWHLTTDCFDIWQQTTTSFVDYITPSFPVIIGVRYKFRIVTTIPSSNTRLYLYNAPAGLETCEVSNGYCYPPSTTVPKSRTASPSSSISASRSPGPTPILNSSEVPCGIKGCLYTMHLPSETPQWFWTSTAVVRVSNGPPVIIGLAGSWIAKSDHAGFEINIDRIGMTGAQYAKWTLVTDCHDITELSPSSDYYAPRFRVTKGKRYRFRIMTEIPSNKTLLRWYNSPNDLPDMETCENSNVVCSAFPSRSPTHSQSPAQSKSPTETQSPEPTISESPFPTLTETQSAVATSSPTATPIADPKAIKCGTIGLLYTIHEENAKEEWCLTSKAAVYSTGDKPVIIGLIGSWISQETNKIRFVLSRNPKEEYSKWNLTTDCFQIIEDAAFGESYKTPEFPVESGVRYRFRIMTTIPSTSTSITIENLPSDTETCESSDNYCYPPASTNSLTPTLSQSPIATLVPTLTETHHPTITQSPIPSPSLSKAESKSESKYPSQSQNPASDTYQYDKGSPSPQIPIGDSNTIQNSDLFKDSSISISQKATDAAQSSLPNTPFKSTGPPASSTVPKQTKSSAQVTEEDTGTKSVVVHSQGESENHQNVSTSNHIGSEGAQRASEDSINTGLIAVCVVLMVVFVVLFITVLYFEKKLRRRIEDGKNQEPEAHHVTATYSSVQTKAQ
jgi:hypothetical protein